MSDLPGWRVDPWLRHEARYFSEGQPTDLVRDGAAESRDPPPSALDPLVSDPPPARLSHADETPEHVFEGANFERRWGGSLGYDQETDGSRPSENWVDRLVIPVYSFLRPSRFRDPSYPKYVLFVTAISLGITLVVLFVTGVV